ncbi:putative lipoprotein [Collimonas pratensis]|uniref:Lipoprotein n=1 Tax=Collimonas pratensis TaxID=279113 RepID=A0A127QA36_9BURK|nr:putative lipoprotein [Collimonas pratensis]AMP16767.1 putative lipoprotein [Collimonas pratensis]
MCSRIPATYPIRCLICLAGCSSIPEAAPGANEMPPCRAHGDAC